MVRGLFADRERSPPFSDLLRLGYPSTTYDDFYFRLLSSFFLLFSSFFYYFSSSFLFMRTK